MTRRLKILNVCYGLAQGGAERLLEQLAEPLRQLNVESSYFVYNQAQPQGMGEVLSSRGHEVIYHQRASGWSLQTFKALKQAAKETKADLIHSQDYGAIGYAGATRIGGRGPTVVHTEHAPHYWIANQRSRLLFRASARFCNRVILVSDAVKGEFQEQLPTLIPKCETIPNGIDEEQFYPQPWAESPVQIAAVSRISPEKNLAHVIASLKIAIDEGANVHLHHIGSGDSDLTAELVKKVDDLGLKEHVTFHGFQQDIRPILSRCQIFVSSSLAEAHPVAVMEAMALGKFAMISRIAPHELIPANLVRFHDLTAAQDSEQGLGRQLAEISSNIGTLNATAKAGSDYIREEFSISKMANRYRSLYDRVLNE